MIGEHELVSVGLSHRTAPVHVREQLAIPADRVAAHLQGLREHGSQEALILSTCNRVEVYAVVDPGQGHHGVLRYLARAHGVRERSLERHTYRFQGSGAVAHLFRVASSLDSLVLGEPQILGQVKTAFAIAAEHHAVGRVMQPLLRRTLHVAKKVRTETRIGRASVSVGSAGVDLAKRFFGSLDKRRVLMVGAGEMGRLVGQALFAQGAAELVITNRSYPRAATLAQDLGATAVHMEQLDDYLERVDIVVVSTGSQDHLITRAQMAPIQRARRYRPLLLVDLSVPRNVAPDVHELEGAFLYNIDDLQQLSQGNLERRQQAATRAEALVAEEAERCYRSLGARTADPVIARVTAAAERARQLELERSHHLMEALDPDQRRVVDAMTRAMFKRFLHNGLAKAKDLAERGDTQGLQVLDDAFGQGDDT